MSGQYLMLAALFFAVFASPSSAASCSLTADRTSTGSSLKCNCPGIHTTRVPIVASVDVGIDCLNNCLLRTTESACDAGSSSGFNNAARRNRMTCCGRCGGTFKDARCNRVFLESRPLPDISEGCATKIRETVMGQSYACRCASGRNFEVPFFIATGVDDDCLLECGRAQDLDSRCTEDAQESAIREEFRFLFELCCAKSCSGINRDGGFTCGFDLDFLGR